ncbi:MAG: TonB C-terminal domain-containing protein [Oligoflexales bacterium]|nr:TonB C-terminal domain-containing protein [Oligoflexales bacterium]
MNETKNQKVPWLQRFLALAKDQELIVRRFIFISLFVHIGILVFSRLNIENHFKRDMQEWVIETDLSFDTSLLPEAKETALPDVKIAEAPAVEKNILPQLPKTYSLKEQEEEIKEEEKIVEDIKKDENESEKPIIEEPKPAPAPKPPEEDNKLEELDLRKRQALEALRKQNQFADERQAQKSSALASLEKQINIENSDKSVSSQVGDMVMNKYLAAVKSSVHRCYSLPDTYQIKRKDLEVIVEFYIDSNGSPRNLEMVKSSDDSQYDQLVLQSIENCSPLPEPPMGKATDLLRFRFNIND